LKTDGDRACLKTPRCPLFFDATSRYLPHHPRQAQPMKQVTLAICPGQSSFQIRPSHLSMMARTKSRAWATYRPLRFGLRPPGEAEQLEIATCFKSIDQKVISARRKVAALQDLFRTLLHELMTAKIRRYHRETAELFVSQQLFTATDAIGFSYGVSWNTVRRCIFNWKLDEPQRAQRTQKEENSVSDSSAFSAFSAVKNDLPGRLEARVKSFCASTRPARWTRPSAAPMIPNSPAASSGKPRAVARPSP
jgi:hypothetical protein